MTSLSLSLFQENFIAFDFRVSKLKKKRAGCCFFARVCVASFPPLVSLSLSLCLFSVLRKKKKTNRSTHALCATLKRHISIILEHGGFHGEKTTFAKTTTTLATMRLSRASRGRRARAFDGRFRKCAPSAHFFFSVSIQARWIRGRKRAVVPSLWW